MTQKTEIYKCQVCGNTVEILHEGIGELVCCSKTMIHLVENTDDTASKEKHVPVFQDGKIKVGSTPHPMEEEHHIEFIEAISPDKKYIIRKYLGAGEEAVMDINYDYSRDAFTMRELCNLHGVWTGEKHKQ